MSMFNNMPTDDAFYSVRNRRNFEGSIPGVGGVDDFGSPGDSYGGYDDLFDSGPSVGGDFYGPSGGFGLTDDSYGFAQSYDVPDNKPQQVTPDDPIVIVLGKNAYAFCKEVLEVLNDFTSLRKVKFGQFTFYAGVVLGVLGVVGLFLPYISFSTFVPAGLFSCGIGGFMLLTGTAGLQKESAIPSASPESLDSSGSVDVEGVDEDFRFAGVSPEVHSGTTPMQPSWLSDDDEDDWDDDEDDWESDTPAVTSSNSAPAFVAYEGLDVKKTEEVQVTPEEILAKVEAGNNSFVTRRYLYDCAMPLLEGVTPNYSATKKLPEDSKEFLSMCEWVEQAARVTVGKLAVSDVPKVLEVKDSLFYLKCTMTRPRWFTGAKGDTFEKELRSLCAFREDTGKFDEGVTVSSNQVGDRVFVKVMKGETAMITVRDILANNEEFFMNSKNKQPVIWGVDADGNAVINDFNKLTGLFFSGAPRTGKSWAIKAIISQLMWFNSPSELQFYFIDPKGPTSDFYSLKTLHIRDFSSKIPDVLEVLRYMVEDEAQRREKILHETGPGYVNIEDFKKDHPTYELPYVLVVIDEIMSLSQVCPRMRRRCSLVI